MDGQLDDLDFELSEAMEAWMHEGGIWANRAFNVGFIKMMKKNQTC